MDLKINFFDNINIIGPSNNCSVYVEGVDADDILDSIETKDIARYISVPDILEHHDHHELIWAIGDIEKFVEVFGRAAILDFLDVNENEEEL